MVWRKRSDQRERKKSEDFMTEREVYLVRSE